MANPNFPWIARLSCTMTCCWVATVIPLQLSCAARVEKETSKLSASPFADKLPLRDPHRKSANLLSLVQRPPQEKWRGGRVERFVWPVPDPEGHHSQGGGEGPPPQRFTLVHFTSEAPYHGSGPFDVLQTVSLLFLDGANPYQGLGAHGDLPPGHPGAGVMKTDWVVPNLISAFDAGFRLAWTEDLVRRTISSVFLWGPGSMMANSSMIHRSLQPELGDTSWTANFLGADVNYIVPGRIVGYMVTDFSPCTEKKADSLEIEFQEIATSMKKRGLGQKVFDSHFVYLVQQFEIGSKTNFVVNISIQVADTNEAAQYWSKRLGQKVHPGEAYFECTEQGTIPFKLGPLHVETPFDLE